MTVLYNTITLLQVLRAREKPLLRVRERQREREHCQERIESEEYCSGLDSASIFFRDNRTPVIKIVSFGSPCDFATLRKEYSLVTASWYPSAVHLTHRGEFSSTSRTKRSALRANERPGGEARR